MKDNRSNRKLRFITLKNRLRTGVTSFYAWEKTDTREIVSVEFLQKLVSKAKISLLKEYKLKLPKCTISSAAMAEDFIKHKTTYRVRLFLK